MRPATLYDPILSIQSGHKWNSLKCYEYIGGEANYRANQVSGKWWLKRWSTGRALLCMHARDQIEYAIKLIIIIIESGGGGLQILLFKYQHLLEPAECLSLRSVPANIGLRQLGITL